MTVQSGIPGLTKAQESTTNYGVTPPQVVVNTNQAPYLPPNPYMTAPAYMLQTSTPPVPILTENKVVEIVSATMGKFKEELLGAIRPEPYVHKSRKCMV